jgi:ubiquinone biosynthesis monooxygenase Coq7
MRNNHPIDPLLMTLDRALRSVFVAPLANRPLPQPAGDPSLPEAPLTEAERKASAALMRVNHAGEVAAQALYHGQAAFAARPEVRTLLEDAAREEADHLAWCEQRPAIAPASAS